MISLVSFSYFWHSYFICHSDVCFLYSVIFSGQGLLRLGQLPSICPDSFACQRAIIALPKMKTKRVEIAAKAAHFPRPLKMGSLLQYLSKFNAKGKFVRCRNEEKPALIKLKIRRQDHLVIRYDFAYKIWSENQWSDQKWQCVLLLLRSSIMPGIDDNEGQNTNLLISKKYCKKVYKILPNLPCHNEMQVKMNA